MTGAYRLWFTRRDANAAVQGPFPELLICQYIVLNRIGIEDEVSQDGTYWRQARDVPVLMQGVDAQLSGPEEIAGADPQWAEERSKAALRWIDDRKSPDPRAKVAPQQVAAPYSERRSGNDRRQHPETVEQVVYREWRGEYVNWERQRRQRYGMVAGVLLAAALATALVVLLARPVNPVKVGLQLQVSNCEALPGKGVNWSSCDKNGLILAGADLRGAELVGAGLTRANLSYADLSRANLLHADLKGANLAGARLDEATWVDGRTCAVGSVGRCN